MVSVRDKTVWHYKLLTCNLSKEEGPGEAELNALGKDGNWPEPSPIIPWCASIQAAQGLTAHAAVSRTLTAARVPVHCSIDIIRCGSAEASYLPLA